MSLFRLDASIRVEGSHSRAIADIVEQEWRNAHRRRAAMAAQLAAAVATGPAEGRLTPPRLRPRTPDAPAPVPADPRLSLGS